MTVALTKEERAVINQQIEFVEAVLANPLLSLVHRREARQLWASLILTRDEGWDRDE